MRGKPVETTPEMKWWKVVKTRVNGRIYGARRAVDDVFKAPESAMTFDKLAGLVEETVAPAVGNVNPTAEARLPKPDKAGAAKEAKG
jgi:hypothetical protein